MRLFSIKAQRQQKNRKESDNRDRISVRLAAELCHSLFSEYSLTTADIPP